VNAGARQGALPLGVVTFLFTDIEGSTRRWEADPEAMRAALAAHDDVLRTAIEARPLSLGRVGVTAEPESDRGRCPA